MIKFNNIKIKVKSMGNILLLNTLHFIIFLSQIDLIIIGFNYISFIDNEIEFIKNNNRLKEFERLKLIKNLNLKYFIKSLLLLFLIVLLTILTIVLTFVYQSQNSIFGLLSFLLGFVCLICFIIDFSSLLKIYVKDLIELKNNYKQKNYRN